VPHSGFTCRFLLRTWLLMPSGPICFRRQVCVWARAPGKLLGASLVAVKKAALCSTSGVFRRKGQLPAATVSNCRDMHGFCARADEPYHIQTTRRSSDDIKDAEISEESSPNLLKPRGYSRRQQQRMPVDFCPTSTCAALNAQQPFSSDMVPHWGPKTCLQK
jgi:hypothetical protein